MNEKTMTEQQLLEWSLAIIQREQRAGTFGTVKIQMQGGRIVRAQVETSETPGDPVAFRRYPELKSVNLPIDARGKTS